MAIVKKYISEVTEISNPAEEIYTVKFKSLNGVYKYLPGQFLHLALEEYDPSNCWPESRCFSIQSNPTETTLKITYAVKGNFTERMAKELKTGSRVTLKMPYGDLFTQKHNKENTIFIAGGTGITPYLSLFTDNTFAEYKNPVLYAGFRDSNFNLYQNEIESAKDINPTLKTNLIFENIEGPLNIEKIFLNEGLFATYFLSGPPSMLENFKTYLSKQNVPMHNILLDKWN